MVRGSIEADVAVLDRLHEVLLKMESTVLAQAREAGPVALQLLRSIPGVGKILSLVILHEIEDVNRFAVGSWLSSRRGSPGRRKIVPPSTGSLPIATPSEAGTQPIRYLGTCTVRVKRGHAHFIHDMKGALDARKRT